MAEPIRHRQTKEAATDMFSLQPPRHISTLHIASFRGNAAIQSLSGSEADIQRAFAAVLGRDRGHPPLIDASPIS